jgi:hypothetical protein
MLSILHAHTTTTTTTNAPTKCHDAQSSLDAHEPQYHTIVLEMQLRLSSEDQLLPQQSTRAHQPVARLTCRF